MSSLFAELGVDGDYDDREDSGAGLLAAPW